MDNYNSTAKVIKFTKDSSQTAPIKEETTKTNNSGENNTQAIDNGYADIIQELTPFVKKTPPNIEQKAHVAEVAAKKITELRPLELYKALLATQAELPTIYKNTKAYNYNYVTYEALAQAVFPCMHKHGLLYTATIDEARLECKLIHAESGQALTSVMVLNAEEIAGAKMLYPQKIGSLISYYKRYILGAFLGLGSGTEDIEQIQAKMEQSASIAKQAQNARIQRF